MRQWRQGECCLLCHTSSSKKPHYARGVCKACYQIHQHAGTLDQIPIKKEEKIAEGILGKGRWHPSQKGISS